MRISDWSSDVCSSDLLFAGGAVGRGYPAEPDIKLSWGEFTGRAGVDWQPALGFTDQTLLYAFYSRGYKAGGMNPPTPGVASTQQWIVAGILRSEEHTSELQSLMRISYAVFCLTKKTH